MYLYLYISYSECVPVCSSFRGFRYLFWAFKNRSVKWLCWLVPSHCRRLAGPAVAGPAGSYLACCQCGVGFVILGTPRDSVLGYFATVLGLRFPFLSLRLFDQSAIEAGLVAFFLVSLALAFWSWFAINGATGCCPVDCCSVWPLLSPGRATPRSTAVYCVQSE